ncbi:hypothetical protein BGX34_010627 [Mortierella sp. NVP85]|nr:hypothetical protein BGX34_010627 [Mortierella sp. NVP85]
MEPSGTLPSKVMDVDGFVSGKYIRTILIPGAVRVIELLTEDPPKMKQTGKTTKERIPSLLQARTSIQQVAREVGVSATTVSRLKKSCLPSIPNLTAGRPRILSDRALRDINRKVLSGSCETGKDVQGSTRSGS